MSINIKQPSSEDEFKSYYYLRWKLLRAPWNQPQGSEVDAIEGESLHFMAVEENETVGVARLQFNSESEAQVRYMAVSSSHERRGIGRDLMTTMETHARTYGCKLIVLDAREPAVGFYQKLGYNIDKKSYLLFDEIQHFRMIKELVS